MGMEPVSSMNVSVMWGTLAKTVDTVRDIDFSWMHRNVLLSVNVVAGNRKVLSIGNTLLTSSSLKSTLATYRYVLVGISATSCTRCAVYEDVYSEVMPFLELHNVISILESTLFMRYRLALKGWIWITVGTQYSI